MRRLPASRFETSVALAAATALEHDDLTVFFEHIGDYAAAFGVANYSALGNFYHKVVSALTAAIARRTPTSVFGTEVLFVAEIYK